MDPPRREAVPGPEGEGPGSAGPARVQALVGSLVAAARGDGNARRRALAAVDAIGAEGQRAVAQAQSRLAEPTPAGEAKPALAVLTTLGSHVAGLAPRPRELEPGWIDRWLGFLPFVSSPQGRYLRRIAAGRALLEPLLREARRQGDALRRDNRILEGDAERLAQATAQLQAALALGRSVDAQLDGERPALDPDAAAWLREAGQWRLRQRLTGLEEQLAVAVQAQQSILALLTANRRVLDGMEQAVELAFRALEVLAGAVGTRVRIRTLSQGLDGRSVDRLPEVIQALEAVDGALMSVTASDRADSKRPLMSAGKDGVEHRLSRD
jgi:hypothetical protein